MYLIKSFTINIVRLDRLLSIYQFWQNKMKVFRTLPAGVLVWSLSCGNAADLRPEPVRAAVVTIKIPEVG